MSLRARLLDAIYAAPEDDAPRRVYADHLEQRGHPHGELIQVQCELARLDEYADARPSLRAAEQRLLATPGRFLRRLGTLGVRHAHFHRGFIDWIYVRAADFIAHGEEIVAQAPLLHGLRLGRVHREALVEIAAMPALRRIRSLSLFGPVARRWQQQDPPAGEAAEALGASPHVEGLRALELRHCRLRPSELAALARGPRLRLRALDLTDSRLDDLLAAHALATMEALPELRRLWLTRAMGGEVLDELLAAPGLRLEELHLVGVRLAEPSQRRIAEMSSLRVLDVSHNAIDVTLLPAVERLALRGCLAPPSMRALLSSPKVAALRELDLGVHSVGQGELIDAITTSPQLARLERLLLPSCLLDDEAIARLARAENLPSLRYLAIHNHRLTSAGARALAASTLPRLRVVDGAFAPEVKAVLGERYWSEPPEPWTMLTP